MDIMDLEDKDKIYYIVSNNTAVNEEVIMNQYKKKDSYFHIYENNCNSIDLPIMNYNINGYNELKEYLADIIDNKEIDNRELLKVVISSIAIKNSVNNDDCNVTGEQQENTVCPFIYEF